MSKSPVRWVSDAQWKDMSVPERALQVAAQECDVFKVKEVGHNRGERVEMYQRAAGVGPGSPYCACFVTWCLKQAGYAKYPQGPAAVRNWAFKDKGVSPKRGDLFYWLNPNGTGHIGFVTHVVLGFVRTIEANTDADGSREGDGVYRKTRRISKLRFIRL